MGEPRKGWMRLALFTTGVAAFLLSSCSSFPIRSALDSSADDVPAEADSPNPSQEYRQLEARFHSAESLMSKGQELAALDSLRSLVYDLRDLPGRQDSLHWSLQLAATRRMVDLLERTGPDPGEDEGFGSLDFQLQLRSDSLRAQGPEAEDVLGEVLADRSERELEIDSLLTQDASEPDSFPALGKGITEIPECDRAEVDRMVEYFVNGRGRKFYQIWLDRYPTVAPTIQRVLAEEGLPQDLIFLAMIESGFRLSATSRAKARGPWQFITGTAHLFDLRVDYWVDERLDLELGTRAACRFLRKLYTRYGDWYMAFAAYNWGPGRIDRAKARGITSFWDIERMPSETRAYVPTYLAARRVFQDRELYGFTLETPPPPMPMEVVQVDGAMRVSRLADLFGMDEAQLGKWNLHLVQGSTPPDGGNVYVPAGQGDLCRERLQELPESAFQDWVRHKVKRGESLSAIARRYGVGTAELRQANNLGKKTKLKSGRVLLIPLGTQERVVPEEREERVATAKAPQRSKSLTHKVKRGDTLSALAKRYKLSVGELAAANKLSTRSKLKAGDKLRIPGRQSQQEDLSREAPDEAQLKGQDEAPDDVEEAAAPALEKSAARPGIVPVHKVKRGEVLDRIARRYGLSVNNLLRWNQLGRKARIYPGQELLLADPDSVEQVDQKELALKAAAGKRKPEKAKAEAPKAKSREPRVHVVRAGETAGAIAQRYGVSVKDLVRQNKLGRKARIATGQRLQIPGGGAVDNQQVVHIVRSGDSLWSLAKQYKVEEADIRKWNNLRGSDIQVGTRLVIILSEEG
jgi:membrane-bound lytic murein transglycosylase D